MSEIRLAGIRVIVFDLDDTLYPERDFAMSGFRAVGRVLRRRSPCPFDPAERMSALFDAGQRAKIFDKVLQELGADPSPDNVGELVQLYRTHLPAIELFEDAESVIREWSGRFQLALISDGYAQTQRNKVRALRLEGLLDPIVLTDEWGREYWKPHPRAFKEIERRTGISSAGCAYVADNPAKDFVAPRQLGWVSIRVRRPGGVYTNERPPAGGEPSYEVMSLRQIGLSS